MKQKQANRPDWGRILERRYEQKYIQDESYEGYITYLFLDKVKDRLIVQYDEEEICIVDDGYVWMMFFPADERYSLTVMIDQNDEVIQWYFDIIHRMVLSPEGIPMIHDLYLDLVYLPNGKCFVKDVEELEDARKEGVISEDEFNMAMQEGMKLQNSIANQTNGLINHINKYIQRLKRKKDGEHE